MSAPEIHDDEDSSYEFAFGDIVRSLQNPHLTGQVIGEADWGNRYNIRLADGASTIWWYFNELELEPEYAESIEARKRAVREEEALADNVIDLATVRSRGRA